MRWKVKSTACDELRDVRNDVPPPPYHPTLAETLGALEGYSVMSEVKDSTVEKASGMIVDQDQRIQAQAALISELVGALESAQQYIPIDAVECRGAKCREHWCISCFGEDDAAKAIEDASNHNIAIKAVLTKAKGSEQ